MLSFRENVPYTVEHLKDMTVKKISAIEGRGSKEDFYDLYFLLQRFTLEEILDFYHQKHPNFSMFWVRQTLTYFEDAEKQDDPKLFENVDWKTVKESISQAVRQVDWSRYLE